MPEYTLKLSIDPDGLWHPTARRVFAPRVLRLIRILTWATAVFWLGFMVLFFTGANVQALSSLSTAICCFAGARMLESEAWRRAYAILGSATATLAQGQVVQINGKMIALTGDPPS